MNFEKLNADTNCVCAENGIIDNDSHFALKINKDKMRDVDFKTYWEKGRTSNECIEVCSLKGQSLTIVNTKQDLENTMDQAEFLGSTVFKRRFLRV